MLKTIIILITVILGIYVFTSVIAQFFLIRHVYKLCNIMLRIKNLCNEKNVPFETVIDECLTENGDYDSESSVALCMNAMKFLDIVHDMNISKADMFFRTFNNIEGPVKTIVQCLTVKYAYLKFLKFVSLVELSNETKDVEYFLPFIDSQKIYPKGTAIYEILKSNIENRCKKTEQQ